MIILSTIILVSIVAIPSIAANSFADKDIENEIHFECNYEGSGNGDNIPAFAEQTNSNLPLTGAGGPGASSGPGGAGTSGGTTANTGNTGDNNGASTATGGNGGSGGSGGSSSIGDNNSEQAEANVDERNPCILESNIISIDED